jgi:hypothetical protein
VEPGPESRGLKTTASYVQGDNAGALITDDHPLTRL